MASGGYKDRTVQMRMRVNERLFLHLKYLKMTTEFGASEGEVATYLITDSLRAMRQSGESAFDNERYELMKASLPDPES